MNWALQSRLCLERSKKEVSDFTHHLFPESPSFNLKPIIDPAPYVAYDLIYSLISRISSRAFVGAPACYDKVWVEAVNAFPMDVEKVKFALLIFPASMRSWIVPFLPQKWRLTRNHRNVRNLLFPASKLQKSQEDFTVLNFLLQTSKDTDPETLTSRMILLTAAAVSKLGIWNFKKTWICWSLRSSITHQWRQYKWFTVFVQCRNTFRP